MLLDKIKTLAAQHQAENIAIRRHLHAHPELSYQEFETSKYVQAKLTAIGIPFTVIATTGVLGIIEGKNPSKRVIALRADMDALPILEENEIDYKSNMDGLNEGKLSFRKGRVMASADELYISIKGPGGHAATPHQTVDTILVAAQLIQSLQTIISRNRNPQNPSVLSICSIHGGNTTNVIPSEVKLMGTFRAMDEVWRFKAHELMLQQAKGLALATGAEIDFKVDVGYPTVDNEPMITEAAWRLADQYMGKDNVEETEKRMGAEDFGYYSQVIPGCFFRLGVRNESMGIVHNVHTPSNKA